MRTFLPSLTSGDIRWIASLDKLMDGGSMSAGTEDNLDGRLGGTRHAGAAFLARKPFSAVNSLEALAGWVRSVIAMGSAV